MMHAVLRARAVLALYDARRRLDEFNEADHPRAPDGKWGEGDASGGSSKDTGGSKGATGPAFDALVKEHGLMNALKMSAPTPTATAPASSPEPKTAKTKAPSPAAAAAKVARAKERVAKAADLLKTTKAAHVQNTKAARSALKDAKAAAAKAKKSGSAKDKRSADAAVKKAERAQSKAEKSGAKLEKIRAVHDKAKDMHVAAKGGHANSKAKAVDKEVVGKRVTKETYKTWQSQSDAKLSEAQNSAMVTWSGDKYTDINGPLRADSKASGELGTVTDHIDAAIAKNKAPHDLAVFRGGMDASFVDHLKEGMVFHDKGFMATSPDQKVAQSFGGNAIFHITVPKGFSAMPMVKNGRNRAEAEVLLPRGSRLLITKVTQGQAPTGRPSLGKKKTVSVIHATVIQ